ncbi:MAG: glycosyltransferase family 2 protein [Anaerolineae bacterium]
MRISAVILARNNENEIRDCLESVAWADEKLVILDSRSNDRTRDIAASLNAQVIVHAFESFAAQRNFALEMAHGEWVFFLDTDERAPGALCSEINTAVDINQSPAGWWIPRHNYVWGRIIKHGGWYPDYQLRLIKQHKGRYDTRRPVHEVVILDGPEGCLKQPLIHYNYTSIRQFIAKQRQYVAFEADIRYQQGIHPKPWTWISMPLREFNRRYFKLQGFRDGWRGLVLATLIAYYYGYVATRLLAKRIKR